MFRFFETLVDPFEPHSKQTPPSDLWAFYRYHLSALRRWIPWIMLTGLVAALIESGLIFYSGRLIDLMSEAGVEAFWATHGTEVLVVAALILFIRPLAFGLSHLFLEQTLASNMQEQVRWRAHRHMLGQSVGFFQSDFAGRLSNRVMQTGPSVEDSVYMAFEGIWFAGTYALGAALLLAQIDWRLAVPLLAWLAIYIAYVRSIAVRVAVASEKHSDARSMVAGRVVDAYSNIETVKLFAQDGREEAYVLNAMRRLRLRWQRFLRLMTELQLGLTAINGLLIIGVLTPAILLWQAGTVSVGEVAAASALCIRLNGMSGWIMWVTIRLFEHFGVIREGLRSIAVDHAVTDRPEAGRLAVSQAEIRFEGLSHHYGKETGGLDGVSLTIRGGERVGLVGRSGAGKSSLVNLLLRFRDVEQGRILIDGQDISGVSQDSLRAQIGMVTQDSSLLHRSIRANILYGRPDATEAQMIAAAERAEAHAFILGLQDPEGRTGYDAQVGERGVKLSGGQRQRIALARVILKDAPILVLDEATSALDSEVEAAIQDTLYGVMEGKTVIAIAHRLSTIRRMDRIVVMDQGRIAEEGTHETLLAKGGLYAGFWERQSGGLLGTRAAE
ncbi:MAG: ABC transporter ATP-binding protein [Pseudomonadota bacterium]